METSLIVRRDSKIEKIRKLLTRIFFKKEYYLEKQLDELFKPKRINISKIVIPQEINRDFRTVPFSLRFKR